MDAKKAALNVYQYKQLKEINKSDLTQKIERKKKSNRKTSLRVLKRIEKRIAKRSKTGLEFAKLAELHFSKKDGSYGFSVWPISRVWIGFGHSPTLVVLLIEHLTSKGYKIDVKTVRKCDCPRNEHYVKKYIIRW